MAETAAAAGSVPRRLGPAAIAAALRQASAPDRDRTRSRCRPLCAVTVVAGADGDRHIARRVVRIILSVRRGIRIAVAVRNGPDAGLGLRIVHASPEVREGSAARFDQEDMTVRAGRADHVEVEPLFVVPTDIDTRWRLPAGLPDDPEAAVGRGARRKTVL